MIGVAREKECGRSETGRGSGDTRGTDRVDMALCASTWSETRCGDCIAWLTSQPASGHFYFGSSAEQSKQLAIAHVFLVTWGVVRPPTIVSCITFQIRETWYPRLAVAVPGAETRSIDAFGQLSMNRLKRPSPALTFATRMVWLCIGADTTLTPCYPIVPIDRRLMSCRPKQSGVASLLEPRA